MSNLDIGVHGESFLNTPRPSRTVASVARELDAASILVRRWLGCWVDFLVLGLMVLIWGAAAQALPDWTAFILLAAMLAYFPVTEGLWGRSLGKLVTGTIVVTEDGRPPGVWRAIVRTLLRLVEVNPFLFGGVPAGLVVLLNKERRRLGDMAAGTYVVPIKDLKFLNPEEAFT